MRALIRALSGIGPLLVMMTIQSCSSKQVGPNGGDIVALNNGQANAEIVANADSGEIMVNTWDQNFKNSQPIESKLLMIGSDDRIVELQPYPTANDPSGFCSRFYGHAEWLRGGQVHNGWLGGSADQVRHQFAWDNCWRGGQTHSSMWNEMGEHRRGMTGGVQGGGMGRQ